MSLHALILFWVLMLTSSIGNAEDVMRFSLGVGAQTVSCELPATKSAPSKTPVSTIYQGDPLSGTFSTNSLITIKTIESTSFLLDKERSLILGIGFESDFSSGNYGYFSKEKGAGFDLRLFSLFGEVGLERKISATQAAAILVEYAYGLNGKINMSYLAVDASGNQYQTSVDEHFTSSMRSSLLGRWLFSLWDPLYLGIEFMGFYGNFTIPGRSSKAIYTGNSVAAKLFLVIN